MLPQLTQSEFKTFILIYAAHIDYNFSDKEKQFIKQKTTNQEFLKMLSLFNDQTDYYSLKIILAHKKQYYHLEKEKHKLYAEITELFKVDGDYSRPERIFLDFLERMINQNNES